ncbi:MAG: lysophospholipid acyltransferase family protein [Candidatus Aegiribacteria sp.]|nr:lysophospholipid acyltransferase family protein [Candidatus Aegiribacteria sp.]
MNGVYLGHLSRVFPETSETRLRNLLKGYWRVHQRALLGLFYSARLSRANVPGIVCWENRDLLDEAVKEGKGVLLLVPHFGDERTLHILLAITGYTMHVISSRYADAPEILKEARLKVSRRWHHVAFPDEPLRWLYDAIERGEVIQISPTGWGGLKGHWVKSFGVPVLASSTPVRLAKSTGCRLLIAYNRVLPGMKYHIAFHRFDPESLDITGTEQLFSNYEAIAKQYPEQYNWMNLVIRHRETNTIVRLGSIPTEESVVEATAVHADWDATNIKDFQTASSISALPVSTVAE